MLDRRKKTWRVEEEDQYVAEGKARRPDILVTQAAKACVGIEVELGDGREVEVDARKYLGLRLRGVGRIQCVIAAKLPDALRETRSSDMEDAVARSEMKVAVLRTGAEGTTRWPEEEKAFVAMDLSTLAACLEHNQVEPEHVARAADALEAAIEEGARVLGEAAETRQGMQDEIKNLLRQEASRQTWAMATAILTNAVAFHKSLAGWSGGGDGKTIRDPDEYRNQAGKPDRQALRKEWHRILKQVNYWPIFSIGAQLLTAVRHPETARKVLEACMEAAETLSSAGALQTQEVMGLALQRLIMDRDVLKTHYTLPASATLMCEAITERLKRSSQDKCWTAVRVLDPACGTGTLLSAMQTALMREAEAAGADTEEAHLALLKSIQGLEVMPAAAHLTATQLSSAQPTVVYRESGIAATRFGHGDGWISLGALDFLSGSDQEVLFQGSEPSYMQAPGTSGEKDEDKVVQETRPKVVVPHMGYDVVVMNPPFTSPTKHEGESAEIPLPMWAAFEQDERTQRMMQKERKRQIREMKKLRQKTYRLPPREPVGDDNAGLGSWFIDLGHEKLKDGGTLGIILPHTATSGEAWLKTQELLKEEYHDVVIYSIASTSTTGRAFSDDTGMAECMILATKGKSRQPEKGYSVTLLQRPASRTEAHAVARLAEDERLCMKAEQGRIEWGDGRNAGSWAREQIGGGAGSAGAENPELVRTVRHLQNGSLQPGRTRITGRVPVTQMGTLGTVGPVDRDLGWRDKGKRRPQAVEDATRGAFRVVTGAPEGCTYPMLWNHHAPNERTVYVRPDCQGILRREDLKEKAEELWERYAGYAHLNRDFQINSQPLGACLTEEPCLGGRGWPNLLCPNLEATVLWENTTPGLMLSWWEGNRTQKGRSQRTVRSLRKHTTLDTRRLTKQQIQDLKGLADEIQRQPEEWTLLPANEAAKDPVRRKLDDTVLRILGIEMKVIDAWWKTTVVQWCREPSVHGGKGKGRRGGKKLDKNGAG